MAPVTIYSDFGAPKVKSVIVSTVSPSTVNYVNLKLLNTNIIGIYKKILEEEKNTWRNNGWKMSKFGEKHQIFKLSETQVKETRRILKQCTS